MLPIDVPAIEMFSAGRCNLDCKYCYIPKEPFLNDIHNTIIQRIESGEYLEWIYQSYGPNVKHFSHWGTEPTLTLLKFIPFYKKAIKIFPKLESIMFSSNFMTNPDIITKFINSLPYDRRLKIDVQMSLDGPAWITDKNRRQGATSIIVENILAFVEKINESVPFHEILTHFKPTACKEDWESFSDIETLREYYQFFDDILVDMERMNARKSISSISPSIDPTIVIPEPYTKQHGLNFYAAYKNQMVLRRENDFKIVRPDSAYYYRMREKLACLDELGTKSFMFSCSAGDTCHSIDEDNFIQPCHRTFYIRDPRYKAALLSDQDRVVKNDLDNGRMDLLKDYVTDLGDDSEVHKYFMRCRSYHDFIKHQLGILFAYGKELAHSGFISEVYKDDRMLEMLVSFIRSSMSCPMENVPLYGNIHINDVEIIKLLGNGTFEAMLKRLHEELN